MRFNHVEKESPENFRLLTGIKRVTFCLMVNILNQAEIKRKLKGDKLSIEDGLLMTLEYLREYRTYFHISRSYSICESAC